MGFYQKMAEEKRMGATPKYKVLTADMLRQADREKAASVVAFIQSDADAYKLAGHDSFAYKDLDLRRRVGVITYKGVEVALMFRREVQELEPGPADPVPEKIITDPKGMWVQVDLLGTDPVEKRKGMGDRLETAIGRVSRLEILWQDELGKRKVLEDEVRSLQKDKETAKGLRERVALLETEKKQTSNEIEGLKRDLHKEKEGRRNDKLDLIRQMFPVFNTVWLAGIHRIGDTLYGIIKQQLVEALEKVSVKLVEPKIGDHFDPGSHHAVHGQVYPVGAVEIDTIVQVHRVGWAIGGRVIEPADVSVGIEKKEEMENGKP